MKTRKELLKEGKVIFKTLVHSTAWYCEGCNGFIGPNGLKNESFASDGSLSRLIQYVEEKFPYETFEVVPVEYNTPDYKPRELTKILIKEMFF